ncbi:MAG: family 43 glycosylhydrolase [Clostridiales bacterium]|nr:family 43 glycosylhydrolase [Clostridiales bacterium]
MKKQVFNPYLPLNEYVLDGEPYVFDGRVYIYGSHDEARGEVYCPGNYVTWSAPVDDLTDWRYEGEIYRRTQDPSNAEDKMQLWAPDVAKGTDGRYYLYYCFSFYPEIGVAVSDSPAGPFAFYGHVHYPEQRNNGAVLREYLPFDPGVLVDDDGRVYLYYGFAPAETNPDYPIIPSPGSMVVELEADMVTVKEGPKLCVPGAARSEGTGFEGHAFYEASSMRKIGETYYFIYSSELSHELCYATSSSPDGGFVYGGTIISNGDVGLNGRERSVNMTGNNHGSIVEINGEWYVFYHRQTHATEASRQGCAEKIQIQEDGRIRQAEITSCGLNGGPLTGKGNYPAAIACHLTGKTDPGMIVFGQNRKEILPYIYEEENGDSLIANITDGVVFGYKYFALENLSQVKVEVRGNAEGTLWMLLENPMDFSEAEFNEKAAGKTQLSIHSDSWEPAVIAAEQVTDGIHPIYFLYAGKGSCSVRTIELL